MNGLYGIIISGKVYEAVETGNEITCSNCELKGKCDNIESWDACEEVFGLDSHFRFSQELTDKLNYGA